MIKIDVEEYCQQCLDFTPDVAAPVKTYISDCIGDRVVQSDTIVRCEYRKRCASIARYLEQHMKVGEASERQV